MNLAYFGTHVTKNKITFNCFDFYDFKPHGCVIVDKTDTQKAPRIITTNMVLTF